LVWYIRWLDIDPSRINTPGQVTGVRGEMLCTFDESGTLVTSCDNEKVKPDQKSFCYDYNHRYNINNTYNDPNIMNHVHNFMSSWSRPALRSVSQISHHVYPGEVVNKINFAHSFRLELTATQPRCTSLSKMITTLDTPYRFKEI
jgi:hypothetical protein